MKLSELIKNLTEMKKKHGNLDVYYAIDEEGNDYKPVIYNPSLIDVPCQFDVDTYSDKSVIVVN